MAEFAPPNPLRVLIVDDCADTTSSLALLVRLWGHQPFVAGDGSTALRLTAEYVPDVILLDIGLPGMSGWELAPVLRRMPGMAGVFLVVASGFDRVDDQRRSHEAGCDLHLTKPVDPERLQQLLAACEKEKRKHDP
jgi:CheY-like chemotaxis protein